MSKDRPVFSSTFEQASRCNKPAIGFDIEVWRAGVDVLKDWDRENESEWQVIAWIYFAFLDASADGVIPSSD